MGCRLDHLGSNPHIKNFMPCYQTGSAEGDARLTASEAQDEATKLCEMLCAACQYIEKYNILMPPSIKKWWNNHKKIDKERIKREKLELEDKRIAVTAKKKLSKREREILGIN